MKTQNEQILEHLKSGKTLTTLVAFQDYQICRLSGRIKEFRDRGEKIETKLVTLDSGKTVASYTLAHA